MAAQRLVDAERHGWAKQVARTQREPPLRRIRSGSCQPAEELELVQLPLVAQPSNPAICCIEMVGRAKRPPIEARNEALLARFI